jgi:hypothetical protein
MLSLCPAPQELAAGDLDQDGKLDLVAASSRHSLSVLRGNGDGTFGTDRTIGFTVSNVRWVKLADMNGDGMMDFVATLTGGGIVVMLGDGAGGSTSQIVTPAIGVESRAFVIGDFDADGDVDVAVGGTHSSGTGGSVRVFPNVGGALGSPQEYALLTRPTCLAAGDINGDGKLDLVTGHSGSFLSILRNTGTGFVLHSTVASRPVNDVVIGDVQGTSDPDICIADSTLTAPGSGIYVHAGDGTGGFGPAANLATLARADAVRLADYDLDGDLDIVGIGREGGGSFGQLCLVRRTGSTYSAFYTVLPGSPRDLAISTASVGGQVVSSAFVTLFDDKIVQSLNSVNGGPFAPIYPAWGVEGQPVGIARGLVNGDGDPDLVAVNTNPLSAFNLQILLALPPVSLPDRAPVIAAPATVNVEANGTLSFPVQAFDLDGTAISSLTATALSGAVFTSGGSNTQGTLTWTPTLAQVGDYTVTFTASNALSGTASTVVHVLPIDTDIAGVFLWPSRAGDTGTHAACFTASGYTGAPSTTSCTTVTVSPAGAASRSPGGERADLASLSTAATPVIGIKGSTAITAGQMLALSAYASTADTLSVNTLDLPADNAATLRADRSPILSAPKTVEGSPGSAISITVTAADPDGEAISTLTTDLSGLPPGNNAAFASNGTHTSGTFTWTPAASDSGTYAVTFRGANVLVGYAGTEIHVRAGLVGYWQVNGNGLDQSGRGVNLLPNGTANYGPGHLNQALVVFPATFGGLYATATADYNLPIGVPWTVECWFRMTTPPVGNEMPIVRAGSPGPGGEYWAFVENFDGSLWFRAEGSGLPTSINSFVPAFDGAWHHAAATSTGASVTLYVDGQVRGTQSWPRGINAAGGMLTLGFDPFGPGTYDASVDEVRIWRVQRTQGELLATMNRELTGYATAVEVEPATPAKTALRQNQPNPFNPRTVITFDTAQSGRASLRIYDAGGRLIRTMLDTGSLATGPHRVTWDGLDGQGRPMASGMYLYRLEAPGFHDAKRMMLLR